MSGTFIVVGGGMAGAKTVEALRDQGFTGQLVLVCEEDRLPYERPPLSKEFLARQTAVDEFTVLTEQWYRDQEIELVLGDPATALHTGNHELALRDGSRWGYDKLVLATGSRPARLPGVDADAARVHHLRKLPDAERLREVVEGAGRLVVIGAGWIGLEVAAIARRAGTRVTVVEKQRLPLLSTLGAELARVFADLHREHGVDLRLDTGVRAVTGAGVTLDDGTDVPADGVLIAVGALPNTELAEGAGLDVADGVLVDAGLTTSDPDVLAVGDIANHLHPLLDTRVRVQHWANALSQPATAASTMLGRASQYTDLPFFFTDQYDLGMEYRGHVADPTAHHVVVRGDLAAREFIAFWLSERGDVRAAMNVNTWDVGDLLDQLLRSDTAVAPETLADQSIPLHKLVT